MKKFTLITAILLINVISFGQIIHVPADQPTIQTGIIAANNGDMVLVDTGIYFENINFLGKAITVASHYLNQKDSLFIFNTIINGSQPINPDIGSVVSFVNGEDTTSYLYGFTITGGTGTVVPEVVPVKAGGGIVFGNSGGKIESNIITENQCVIDEEDGFAMGGGISAGPAGSDHYIILRKNLIINNICWSKGISTSWNLAWGQGGGIFTPYNGVIEENQIHSNVCKSNHGYSVGGGIRLQTFLGDQVFVKISSNRINNNESISANSYAFAGGIGCSAVNTLIDHNEINNNKIEGLGSRGSGLYFDLGEIYSAFVNSNYIVGNYCVSNTSYGGAIGLYRSNDMQLVNNLIIENSAKNGGALFFEDSYPTIINNTISQNIAQEDGGGLFFYDASSGALVINTILWNNSANGQPNEIYIPNAEMIEVVYSDVENGWEGEGNINEDPLFTGTGDFSYSLQDASPCVNTGTPDTTGLNLPEFDLAGNPRLYGGRIDMGAYENQNVIVGLDDAFNQSNFELSVLPNPFSNQTTIEFSLPDTGFAFLSVYGLSGKLRERIVSEKLTSGEHNINWNTERLPAGIYFCVLQTDEGIQTKKMIKF